MPVCNADWLRAFEVLCQPGLPTKLQNCQLGSGVLIGLYSWYLEVLTFLTEPTMIERFS